MAADALAWGKLIAFGPFQILLKGYSTPSEGRQDFSLKLYHYDQRRVICVELKGPATNSEDPDFNFDEDKEMIIIFSCMLEWAAKHIEHLPREVTKIVLSDRGDLLEQLTVYPDATEHINYPFINR